MSSAALVAMPVSGEMTVWRIVDTAQQPSRGSRRRDWSLQVGMFCVGLLATAAAAAAAWTYTGPDTIVRTRIVADGSVDSVGRAALSEVALRLAGASNQAATLQEGGEALVVATQDRDPAEAQQRTRSLVDAILNAPIAAMSVSAPQDAVGPGAGLRTERARLAAAADAVEARSAAISASLTALARDVAAANRNAADRKPGRETLDKGNAALADLLLQRLQLVSKYQDTYPAVLALDGQIRNLRVFLIDEARRIDTRPAAEPTEAMLNGERDRLQAELSQLEERRRAIATNLAGVDRRLAIPPAVSPMEAAPVMAPPVLIAAATTSFPGTDDRLATVPAIAAAGLMLSALASHLVRRRAKRFPPGLVLEPVAGGMLAAGNGRALPSPLANGSFARSLEQPNWSKPSPSGRGQGEGAL